jgi:O-antigen/teichoic acid export membrane protein
MVGRIGGVAGSLAGSQLIIGLIYVLGARSIGPATLGVIASCVAISTIGANVFDMGLTGLLVRDVASGMMEMATARAVVRAKRRFCPVLLVPTTLAGLVLAPTQLSGLVLGLVGPLIWESITANSLMRTVERFTQAAAAQLAGRVSGLAALGGLLGAGAGGVLALPVGLAVSYGVEALIDRVFLGPGRARSCPAGQLLALHRESAPIGLATLAASAQQLDTPMVALGGGPLAAGLYVAAGRLLGPLGFLASALGMVGGPWLARARGEKAALRQEELRVCGVAGALCLVPLLAAAVGPLLIPVVLGSEYGRSGAVFAVLAVGSVFSTLNQPLAIIAINRARLRSVAVAVAVGVGTGLLATVALARLGPVWAAAGFTVSQLYILGHLGLTVRRCWGNDDADR